MKKLIILALAILLVPLVLATTDEIRFIGEQNTALDITEPCFNNNTYCSNTAKCNITIKDPKQVVIINNLEMTNQGAYHNYTLNSSHLDDTGVYESSVICMDGIYNGYDNFYFKVTPNGQELSLVQGVIYIILLIVFLILAIFCVLGAYFIDKDNAYEYGKLIKITYGKYIKLGLAFFSYFLITIIFLFCEMIANNFLFLSFLEGLFHVLYLISAIGLFPAFLVAMIFIIINALRDLHIKKLTKRNLPLR